MIYGIEEKHMCHDRTANLTKFQFLSTELQIGSYVDKTSNLCVSLVWRDYKFFR